MTYSMQNIEDHIADLKFIRQHLHERGHHEAVARIDEDIERNLVRLEEMER